MGTVINTASIMEVRVSMYSFYTLLALAVSALGLKPCPGDTRGDRRCNHDSTHRVCAKIGIEGTSFWEFTGDHTGTDHAAHHPNLPGVYASGQQLGGLQGKDVGTMSSLTVMQLMFAI